MRKNLVASAAALCLGAPVLARADTANDGVPVDASSARTSAVVVTAVKPANVFAAGTRLSGTVSQVNGQQLGSSVSATRSSNGGQGGAGNGGTGNGGNANGGNGNGVGGVGTSTGGAGAGGSGGSAAGQANGGSGSGGGSGGSGSAGGAVTLNAGSLDASNGLAGAANASSGVVTVSQNTGAGAVTQQTASIQANLPGSAANDGAGLAIGTPANQQLDGTVTGVTVKGIGNAATASGSGNGGAGGTSVGGTGNGGSAIGGSSNGVGGAGTGFNAATSGGSGGPSSGMASGASGSFGGTGGSGGPGASSSLDAGKLNLANTLAGSVATSNGLVTVSQNTGVGALTQQAVSVQAGLGGSASANSSGAVVQLGANTLAGAVKGVAVQSIGNTAVLDRSSVGGDGGRADGGTGDGGNGSGGNNNGAGGAARAVTGATAGGAGGSASGQGNAGSGSGGGLGGLGGTGANVNVSAGVLDMSNTLSSTAASAAGVVTISQNSGTGALIQQSVNVQGNVGSTSATGSAGSSMAPNQAMNANNLTGSISGVSVQQVGNTAAVTGSAGGGQGGSADGGTGNGGAGVAGNNNGSGGSAVSTAGSSAAGVAGSGVGVANGASGSGGGIAAAGGAAGTTRVDGGRVDLSNNLSNVANSASGVISISQNTGVGALTQQSVNVQANVGQTATASPTGAFSATMAVAAAQLAGTVTGVSVQNIGNVVAASGSSNGGGGGSAAGGTGNGGNGTGGSNNGVGAGSSAANGSSGSAAGSSAGQGNGSTGSGGGTGGAGGAAAATTLNGGNVNLSNSLAGVAVSASGILSVSQNTGIGALTQMSVNVQVNLGGGK